MYIQYEYACVCVHVCVRACGRACVCAGELLLMIHCVYMDWGLLRTHRYVRMHKYCMCTSTVCACSCHVNLTRHDT